MSDLPGTTSIEYYLKGRALREQREARAEAAKLKAEQIANTLKIAEEAERGRNERDKLRNEIKLKGQELNSIKAVVAIGKALDEETLFLKDPKLGIHNEDGSINYDNIGVNQAGVARKARIEEKEKTEEALNKPKLQYQSFLNPILRERTSFVEGAKFPFQSQLLEQGGRIRRELQDDQQAFLSPEWAKNRQNALDIAAMRRQQDQFAAGDDDAIIQEIMKGNITQESLGQFSGKQKDRIKLKAAKLGVVPIDKKTDEKFSDAQAFNAYLDKAREVHKLMGNHSSVLGAMADTDLMAAVKDLDSIAKAYAVNVAGDKSVLSTKELPIIKQGTISENPGGIVGLFTNFFTSHKENMKINQGRIDNLEDIYAKRLKQFTSGMSPAQKAILAEKYNFQPYKTKEQKLKEKQNSNRTEFDPGDRFEKIEPKKPSAMR